MPTPIQSTFAYAKSRELSAKITALGERMATRPGLANATIAAVLIAPAIFSDDERGYLQTSMITTPLIAAGSMVAPHVWDVGKKEGARMRDILKNDVPPIFQSGKPVIPLVDAKRMADIGNLSAGRLNTSLLNHLVNTSTPDITPLASSLRESVWGSAKKLRREPSKYRMALNAVWHAKMNTGSAEEVAAWKASPEFESALKANRPLRDIRHDFITEFRSHRDNAQWLKHVQARFDKLSHLHDPGGSFAILADATKQGRVSWSDFAREDFVRNGGDRNLMSLIDDLAKHESVDVELRGLLGSNNAINKITGLQIRKGGSSVLVPYVDRKTRGVLLGDLSNTPGVSRLFYDSERVMFADEHAVRAMLGGASPEQVKLELARAQFSQMGKDQLDPKSRLFDPDSAVGEGMTREQMAIYGRQMVPSNIGGFAKGKDYVGFEALDAGEKVSAEMAAVARHNAIKLSGGDASILEDAALAKFNLFGQPNPEKEDLHVKSLKREWRATHNRVDNDPFTSTDFLHAIDPSLEDGTFGIRMGQLHSQEYALAAALPDSSMVESMAISRAESKAALLGEDFDYEMVNSERVSLIDELAGKQSVEYLEKSGMSKAQANKAWEAMRSKFYDSSYYDSFRKLGYMGEGGVAVANDIKGIDSVRRNKVTVDWTSMSEEELMGMGEFDSNTILGSRMFSPMTAGGDRNIIQNAEFFADGTAVLDVEEHYDLDGAKFQADTKWTNSKILQEDVDRIADVFNVGHDAAGTGQFIDQVSGYVVRDYGSEKAVNAAESMMNQTSGLLRKLDKYGIVEGDSVVSGYVDQFEDIGFSWNGHTLEEASSSMAAPFSEANARRIEEANAITKQLFEHVSSSLRNTELRDNTSQGYGALAHRDPFLGNYAHGNQPDMLEYQTRGSYAMNMQVSDHMRTNRPRGVHVNREVMEQLELGGNTDILSAIYGQTTTDGDPGLIREFMAHTRDHLDKDDWDHAFGKLTIDLDSAVGKGTNLKSAAGRAGTIFDPGHPMADDNFGIKTPQGDIIPVPGHNAFGGKVNRHGFGEYSANSFENQLNDLLQIAGGHQEGNYEEARAAYVNKVRALGTGKGGALNVERKVEDSLGGRLTGAPGQDPFVFSVSPKDVHQFSPEVRTMLKDGEEVWGSMIRYPVNTVVHGRIKIDPNIGEGRIGTGIATAQFAGGDFDGDYSFLIATQQKLKDAEGKFVMSPAAAAIKHEATDAGSNQAKLFETLKSFKRVEDDFFDSKGFSPKQYKSVTDRAAVFAQNRNFAPMIQRRTAGMAVGELSNTLELVKLNMLHNSELMNPLEKQTMAGHLYDIIREAPIAAMKTKAGREDMFDLATMHDLSKTIRESLGNRTLEGEDNFIAGLRRMTKVYGKEVDYDPKVHGGRLKYLNADGKFVVNPHENYLVKNEQSFRKVHRGHTDVAQEAFEQLTRSKESVAAQIAAGKKPLSTIADLLESAIPSLQASSMSGATMASSAIGEANEAIKGSKKFVRGAKAAGGHIYDEGMKSAGRVVESMKGHGAGKAVAMGLAIAAGAGLVMGNWVSPRKGQAMTPTQSEVSSNSHRPEERIGTDGSIPGEPISGAMAPSRPVRTIRPAPQGVRTAVVAPMQHHANLEVRMRTEDRDRAAEMARQTARLSSSGGNSNLTINYRNTKSGILRTRDKIADILGNQ